MVVGFGVGPFPAKRLQRRRWSAAFRPLGHTRQSRLACSRRPGQIEYLRSAKPSGRPVANAHSANAPTLCLRLSHPNGVTKSTASSGFDHDNAEGWLQQGKADLIAFGRKFWPIQTCRNGFARAPPSTPTIRPPTMVAAPKGLPTIPPLPGNGARNRTPG